LTCPKLHAALPLGNILARDAFDHYAQKNKAKKAHEIAGYKGVGHGMVGALFGYGVPMAGYGQYSNPTLL
jgi:hypothetical protein